MSLKTKRRSDYLFTKVFEDSQDYGKTWAKGDAFKVLSDSQITDSEGHLVNPNTGYRNAGGPFHTVRWHIDFPTIPIDWKSNDKLYGDRWRVRGQFGTPILGSFLPPEYRLSTADSFKKEMASISLDADGATAIAQCAPTNPNAELLVAIGEILKEGKISLPGIATWKNRLKLLKSAGDEFLSAEFGWLPLIDDIKNFFDSVKHGDDILEQYHRDSGNNVRREFKFPIEESVRSESLGEYYPQPIPGGGAVWNQYDPKTTKLDLTRTVKVQSRKWFSGAFTYHLDDQSDAWSRLKQNRTDADRLFGTTLTPDVLWELTPWSWAVDWFSNTGDVIKNITNLELQGLVMRYGFMMHEKRIEVTNQFYAKGSQSFYGKTQIPPSKLTVVSKRRVQANPFGFGIGWEDLSPTQLAITAALGITRWLR